MTQGTGAGVVTITGEQLQQLIDAAAAGHKPDLTAEALAAAFQTANRRENLSPPDVSIYNPKDERKHPRPELRCKTYLNGVDMRKDTLMWEEIEALNALPPGEFRVKKSDGKFITFRVEHLKNVDGQTLDKVLINIPAKDDERHNHRPLLDYCVDALEVAGETAAVTRITALRKDLDALRVTLRM